jgi:hypothetical protein
VRFLPPCIISCAHCAHPHRTVEATGNIGHDAAAAMPPDRAGEGREPSLTKGASPKIDARVRPRIDWMMFFNRDLCRTMWLRRVAGLRGLIRDPDLRQEAAGVDLSAHTAGGVSHCLSDRQGGRQQRRVLFRLRLLRTAPGCLLVEGWSANLALGKPRHAPPRVLAGFLFTHLPSLGLIRRSRTGFGVHGSRTSHLGRRLQTT